jgi:hypothetical protein
LGITVTQRQSAFEYFAVPDPSSPATQSLQPSDAPAITVLAQPKGGYKPETQRQITLKEKNNA